jgi:hypothetical protein
MSSALLCSHCDGHIPADIFRAISGLSGRTLCAVCFMTCPLSPAEEAKWREMRASWEKEDATAPRWWPD